VLLLRWGAAVDARSASGDQPLHSAARGGHAEAARALLEEGAFIDAAGWCNYTPLMVAATQGHSAVVKLLLARGADVGAIGPGGLQAVHYAAVNGHSATVELLLDGGAAGLEGPHPAGMSLLRYAARGGHVETIELLLARGADLAAQDGLGRQAVHVAIERGHCVAFKLLVSRGARVDEARGREQLHRALESAAAAGHTAAIEVALRHGAALGGELDEGVRRALLAAARNGCTEVVRALLRIASAALVAAPHGGALVRALIGARHFSAADALLAAGAELPAPEGLAAGEAAARRDFELWLREERALVDQERVAARELLLAIACEANRLKRRAGEAALPAPALAPSKRRG
jgi:uncharacterized protein